VDVSSRVRALLEEHAAAIPGELGRALDPGLAFPALPRDAAVVVTGVGGSEGPARYLALLLHLAGRRAVFAPLSTYALTRPAALGDTLVLFSQGLSPNARLALRRAAEHRAAILFTSVDAGRAAPEIRACLDAFLGDGGRVVRLPPDDESGTLVRLVGPAIALVAAARFAASLDGALFDPALLARVPALGASARDRVGAEAAALPPLALHRRLAFVAAGPWLEGGHGLRCAWLEGLGAPEPPLWDVLQIAHGPFHQFFDEEITLVTLEHDGEDAERVLFDRLAAMLVPPRHALLRLRSALPPPLGALDHELLVTALLMRALGERSKDLGGALGCDAPLYGLGRDPPPRGG
jgi:creatinine amidohydrolase